MSIDSEMKLIEHLLDDIDQISRIAHQKYRAYDPSVPIELSPRAAAACVYDHMVAEVDRRWIDRRGIVQKEINGLKVWIVGADAVIRWKKMDEDGYSSNYPTKQARDFDRGELLPGLPDPAVRLTAGYLLDPTQTQFVRAQIAKPRGKRIEWCAAIVPASEPGLSATWKDVTRQRNL